MSLTLYDEFAGWGGSSQGATAVPGVELILAANHCAKAIEVHALNFPAADHHCGDVTKADLTRFPRADLFWASPACPPFSDAQGRKRYFDRATQAVLFEDPTETAAERAARLELDKRRALMEEIPRYLHAMALRGEPVLAGVVENVPPARKWDKWPAWIQAIAAAGPGYRVKVIALNSMHAVGVHTTRAPQSRPRAYVAYWLGALGRDPDWDKWLRPPAYCPHCDAIVAAVQVWKKPGQDMGVYGIETGQYLYRCPNRHGAWHGTRHRPGLLAPYVLPAATAIDWTLPPGAKIGERTDRKGRPDPLKPNTLARIEAALARYAARPLLVPAGGTRRREGYPAELVAMPARTTREGDALVCPPLLVPTDARAGHGSGRPAHLPLRTQTARQETALVLAPFLTLLRGGGSYGSAYGVDRALPTFSANGTHHALIGPPTPENGALAMRNNTPRGGGAQMSTPIDEPLRTLTTTGHQSLICWGDLLIPYYGTGTGQPVTQPVGTLTTRDRYALLGTPAGTGTDSGDDTGGAVKVPDVEECTFRMLTPPEIAAGMAFRPGYKVTGSQRQQVAGYGNAVTPPAAEILICALVEAITGHPLPRPWPDTGRPTSDGLVAA